MQGGGREMWIATAMPVLFMICCPAHSVDSAVPDADQEAPSRKGGTIWLHCRAHPLSVKDWIRGEPRASDLAGLHDRDVIFTWNPRTKALHYYNQNTRVLEPVAKEGNEFGYHQITAVQVESNSIITQMAETRPSGNSTTVTEKINRVTLEYSVEITGKDEGGHTDEVLQYQGHCKVTGPLPIAPPKI